MLTRPISKAEIHNSKTATANQVGSFQRGRLQHLSSRVRSRAGKVPCSG